MSGKYQDIIDLPHHVSKTRPPMPMSDRAAQFSPFAALTGYEEAIGETARLTDQRRELDENELESLNRQLQSVLDQPEEASRKISVTYFQPDGKKTGGAYVTVTDRLKKIDMDAGLLILEHTTIAMRDVSSVAGVMRDVLLS